MEDFEEEIRLSPGQIMMPRIPTVAIGSKQIVTIIIIIEVWWGLTDLSCYMALLFQDRAL